MMQLAQNAAVGIVLLVVAMVSGKAAEPSTKPAFAGATLQRTGGFAGTNDRIEISPEGKVSVSGKLFGKGEGQLDASQLADLAKVFAGWEQLKPAYQPKRQIADGFVHTIRYGDKTVVLADGAEDVPATLEKVRQHLEALAQQFAKKQ